MDTDDVDVTGCVVDVVTGGVVVVVVVGAVVVVDEVVVVVDGVVVTVVVGLVVVVEGVVVTVVVPGVEEGGLDVAVGVPDPPGLVAGTGRVVADDPTAAVGWLDPPLEADGGDTPVAVELAAWSACDWSTN